MKIAVIPDVQVKEGVPIDHLEHVGRFLAEKKPDVIVCIGDFADMPSLSSYDKGKKSFEGRRYTKDIAAAKAGMDALMEPIRKELARQKKNKKKQWKPRFVLTLGNHEYRIERAIECDQILDGVISMEDLPYDEWEVYPYLEIVEIGGVAFSHFFTSGVMGRPVGSARALINKKHTSCVMGHIQIMDIAFAYKPNGDRLTGLLSGTCYQHDEDYLGPQGNTHFRGIHMLYEVKDGNFDDHAISLTYLKSKYGSTKKTKL
jgi:hypothetical protein